MRPETIPAPKSLGEVPLSLRSRPSLQLFVILAGVLAIAFIVPLRRWLGYALQSGSLYSHVLLIPFVSGYLIWIQRASLPQPRRGSFLFSFPFVLAGTAFLLVPWIFKLRGSELSLNDFLSITMASFYSFLVGVAVFALGPSFCRRILFPIAFLALIIPFPEAFTTALETALKYASAEIYAVFMNLLGQTYFRQGLVFSLPNLAIEVAQECSGVRSSLILFITSLLAGHMFLAKARNRALLALLVLPLGAVRNAFRILVLSLLSTHWDPGIINSPLHHRGGALFFALSLIPFFMVLIVLFKREKAGQQALGKSYA